MSIPAVVTSTDGMPEEVQNLYVENDGKFVLDVESVDGYALENVAALKSSLSKERTNVKDAQSLLKGFEGLSPEDAKAAISKVKEMKDWTPEEEVANKIKSREEQLVEKHSREIATLTEGTDTLRVQLENNLVRATATQAISEAGGSTELLLPHVQQYTRMRETESGEYIAEVVDSDGHQRISTASGSTAPMSISELVGEMSQMDAYAPAFKGVGASGSGATGGGSSVDSSRGGMKTVSLSDSEAINANFEAIASGEVQVIE